MPTFPPTNQVIGDGRVNLVLDYIQLPERAADVRFFLLGPGLFGLSLDGIYAYEIDSRRQQLSKTAVLDLAKRSCVRRSAHRRQ